MSTVLLASYSGAFGGAERVLLDFAPALGPGACLACPEGPLAERARAAGVRVWPLPDRPSVFRGDRIAAVLRLAAHRRELRTLVRDLAPSAVIANGSRSALSLLMPRSMHGAPPVVFMQHDMIPPAPLDTIVLAAARRAALVIVPSRAVAEDLAPSVQAEVVHPGVDVERFDGRAEPAQPPVVLLLGAIVGWKEPQLALEALALTRRRRPDARLRVVGAPIDGAGERLLGVLRRRAAQPDLAGTVEFAGPVPDPVQELGQASCLLHCARREPFGMVVLEALAAGRPVVAPAAAGPREILSDGGGLLYPPGDAGSAAEALVEALGRGTALGLAGRAIARERFGLEAARRRFATAVGPLVTQHPPRPPAGLALVTVTHNSAGELAALLRTAAHHLPGTRVIVVDNASTDGTVQVARAAPNATVVELPDNQGFGTASNVGIESVTEPVTALINPDVELLDDSLMSLASELAHVDRLLAPLVISPDGSRQDTVHALPASPSELLSALIPPRALPGPAGAWLAPWRGRHPTRVGWAVGCAVLARTETLRRLGPFDERTFLYGEDLELGLRARATGIETWFCPSARVLHTGGHSTARVFSEEPFELLARARHDAVARGLGSRRARIDDRLQKLTFGSRIVLKTALGMGAERERRQLAAVRGL